MTGNKLVFIGIAEEAQINDFLSHLGKEKHEVHFTNFSIPSSFYEEMDKIKPLIIIDLEKSKIDKNKIKCPIVILDEWNLFNNLYNKTINHELKYDCYINFISKKILFKNESCLINFISQIDDIRIANIAVDSEWKPVITFKGYKESIKCEFTYYNYCYTRCSASEMDKYSLDGVPVKRTYYRTFRDLPEETWEKDLHADYRFIVDYSDYFEPIEKEKLNYMTYDIETNQSVDVINTPGEIISLVYLLNGKYEFLCLENNKGNMDCIRNKPDVVMFNTEKEMLRYFMNIFNKCNVITGFNTDGFDNIYLLNRAKLLGLDQNKFSPIGRVDNRIVEEKDRLDGRKLNIHGVDMIDAMTYAKDKFFIYSLDKPSQYNLDYLGQFLKLGTKVHDTRGPYTQWLEDPEMLYKYNIQDVKLTRDIEEHIGMINYLLSFKNLMPTFNLKWSLYNSKIIDFFILCNYSKDFAFPSKKENEYEELEGAYVKTPISGIYKNVAVCDYKSLYPNIIRQFNISFETITGDKNKYSNNTNIDNMFYTDNSREGLMPKVVNRLMYMKDDISDAMETDDDPLLPVKYNAIKAVINGIYGVSKYKYFRLYNINCARSITHLGRHLIKEAEAIADKKDGIYTIYGDTDSIFVHLEGDYNYMNAKKYFEDLMIYLNLELTKYLMTEYKSKNKFITLEFETLFDRIMMTKAKKKYFGVGHFVKGKDFDYQKAYGRGISIVKKDTPVILRPLLKQLLLDIVLSDKDSTIKDSIKVIKNKMFALDYQDLLITKQISRDLNDYKVTPQHVKAMLYSNKFIGTNFSRANYKGGMLHVINPSTEVIMLDSNIKLPTNYSVNYEKYFDLFVKNPMILYLDRFQYFFLKDKTLDDFFKTNKVTD